ncbi:MULTISPECIES: pimeloyl-ACP methyl ester esterase BioH [Photobacterium]|jgi:pimeloyl-[acyl-carrier protein] methyl ester esterase|uniref:Pimeloyl-[acyl-carrier protein] methyl ester esterase n=1 Tax=Photobacterium alginatilyticum TaxID=1775171 RepID=A0ABW9YIT2_9GAMM|nr:pimeloyl-ACP methyl ester esterase BioH [Photobacterium alginatilyticum]NBI53701.1 pimeloyl-[acyl-carrier protein] methyl ester esterase [Photobacterium alginatilyticum]
MTAKLHWQTEGQGSDLVLIHGWGMNGAVWQQLLPLLTPHFRVHLVDLPGYGHSREHHAGNIEEMAYQLLENSPESAIWLGWSLGGLVATQAAIQAPERVNALVTVASSPRFAAENTWRGIKPQVLNDFQRQLSDDFQLTVERFMALQAMGSPTARQDIKLLKQAVLSRPQPNPKALASGLQLLADVDLREQLDQISQPWLRLYGRLDGLVPVKVAAELDALAPRSERQVFAAASHAPFISHPEEFVKALRTFIG